MGCTVASTLNDEVAIDLAGSSGYDALIIESEVPENDSRYVITKARSVNSTITVILVSTPEMFRMRKYFGLGLWKALPAALRR